MRQFKVSFDVPVSKLTTIIQVLTDDVANLNIDEIPQPKAPITKNASTGHKAPREHRVTAALKVVLADGKVHHLRDFAPALEAAGLSPNSASPGLSKMPEVIRVGNGEYQLKAKANGHAL